MTSVFLYSRRIIFRLHPSGWSDFSGNKTSLPHHAAVRREKIQGKNKAVWKGTLSSWSLKTAIESRHLSNTAMPFQDTGWRRTWPHGTTEASLQISWTFCAQSRLNIFREAITIVMKLELVPRELDWCGTQRKYSTDGRKFRKREILFKSEQIWYRRPHWLIFHQLLSKQGWDINIRTYLFSIELCLC